MQRKSGLTPLLGSWLNRCRAVLVRWDRKAENYLGMIQLACGLLWYRRLRRLTT